MKQEKLTSQKMIDRFTYRITCDKSIENVAQEAEKEFEKHKFTLLNTYCYHELLESKGFPIDRKVWVYEICRAKTAAGILTGFPDFSIYMPCRLAIYEENGKTIISTMNMEMILDSLNSNPSLYREATELFNTLKSLMNSLSGN